MKKEVQIVDAHCHYDRTDEKELISALDRNDIAQAMICPSYEYITVANREGNQRTAKMEIFL